MGASRKLAAHEESDFDRANIVALPSDPAVYLKKRLGEAILRDKGVLKKVVRGETAPKELARGQEVAETQSMLPHEIKSRWVRGDPGF